MKNSFENYGISEEITKALQLLHYENPTEVQERVIPEALGGRDLIVKSETGSGKTAAYGIPLCELVEWNENRPQALVLAPTRDLAMQIKMDIFHIGRLKRIKVPVVYGRASFNYQANELKLKAHIVVGTPGRVLDHIERGTFITDNIRYLVIDEADEMLQMGFLEQVTDIIKLLPKERLTMLFSATFEEKLQHLAAEYMKDPMMIEIESETLTVDRITQEGYWTRENDKKSLLEKVLTVENPERAMIFCNTQEMVDEVGRNLRMSGLPCRGIHGGLEQKDRIRIMELMREGKFRYLVATDVAARGIDIGNITHVINYEVPRLRENYVHRIGRTGRIGKEGKSITFFTDRQKGRLKELEEFTNCKITMLPNPETEAVKAAEADFRAKVQANDLRPERKGQELNARILKLHINAGKKTKMRPTDVVGVICSIDGVTAEDIGVIEIQDISTFVEILNGKGQLVFRELKNRNIKGRPRRVSVKE